jgi:hypothetical protein
MIPLLLMLAADSGPPPWAEFSRSGALSHVMDKVTIDRDPASTPDHYVYRLVYTRTSFVRRDRHRTSVSTTDSRSCSAAGPLVVSMRSLTMPRPAPYGTEDDRNIAIVMDGVGYSLRAPSNFTQGTITITSNVQSPLATWVDKAFTDLAPCWKQEK